MTFLGRTQGISRLIGARLAPRLRRRRDQACVPHGDTEAARPRAQAARTPGRPRAARDRGALRSLLRRPAASANFRLAATSSVDCRMDEMIGDIKKKVVVIGEDDDPIATLLRDSINDEDAYQAVVVSDGALVLETVRQVHADLLILDIMMPGLNGFEVFDRVRADTDIRDMPVLFVSAATNQHESDFAERGITDVISKPFDLNDLLARVRVLCPTDAGGEKCLAR